MGAAAYNRGSRAISRALSADHDAAAKLGSYRSRLEDENTALRERVAALESDLARARRCIALGRYAHEARMREANAAESASSFAIGTLCKLAARVGAPGFSDDDAEMLGEVAK